MQKTTGIYSILSLPFFYELFQKIVGADRKRKILIKDFIKPHSGDDVLDCGCGPAHILKYFPEDINYTGIDLSTDYISKAKKLFPDASFKVSSVDDFVITGKKFDIILALGLLHHIDDESCKKLFSSAYKLLKKNGRMITQDGVFVKEQSFLAKFLLKRDRGQFVRDKKSYEQLAQSIFGKDNVDVTIKSDLTRIPYTHIIMQCKRD